MSFTLGITLLHNTLLIVFYTFNPETTSYLSDITLVKELDNVAVSIEQMVIPIIIHTTEKSLPTMDFGVLSPYL